MCMHAYTLHSHVWRGEAPNAESVLCFSTIRWIFTFCLCFALLPHPFHAALIAQWFAVTVARGVRLNTWPCTPADVSQAAAQNSFRMKHQVFKAWCSWKYCGIQHLYHIYTIPSSMQVARTGPTPCSSRGSSSNHNQHGSMCSTQSKWMHPPPMHPPHPTSVRSCLCLHPQPNSKSCVPQCVFKPVPCMSHPSRHCTRHPAMVRLHPTDPQQVLRRGQLLRLLLLGWFHMQRTACLHMPTQTPRHTHPCMSCWAGNLSLQVSSANAVSIKKPECTCTRLCIQVHTLDAHVHMKCCAVALANVAEQQFSYRLYRRAPYSVQPGSMCTAASVLQTLLSLTLPPHHMHTQPRQMDKVHPPPLFYTGSKC